jgi:hypothetical protein
MNVCLFVCLFAALGIELRASHMLGKHSTTLSTPLAFCEFCFWYIFSLTLPKLASNWNLPASTSQLPGITVVCHHTQLFLWILKFEKHWVECQALTYPCAQMETREPLRQITLSCKRETTWKTPSPFKLQKCHLAGASAWHPCPSARLFFHPPRQ